MSVSCSLIQAYLNAKYVVCTEPQITMRVNEFNADLLQFLAKNDGATAAFITAYNPFSNSLTQEENERRHANFLSIILEKNMQHFVGFGTDEAKDWPQEQSLLLLNIGKPYSTELAKKFGQNAIVWIEDDAIPRLLITQ
ncbi:hypothetical protein BM528_00410 [Alteromonas sp. RW2A1]|uniref:DUF3293 domain-containing protein n=1 Tax=Alteromonas sp. RW2A1 TaxID=1917158 RepID=UPI000904492A|nr:DUF3293 domain-containing protein [Alteromonas sp. RW2A1]APE04423.1 hypothetical protein BM528_00410 [Alteromonas sp. RW2A1]